jgi:hypothetical protein
VKTLTFGIVFFKSITHKIQKIKVNLTKSSKRLPDGKGEISDEYVSQSTRRMSVLQRSRILSLDTGRDGKLPELRRGRDSFIGK